MPSYPHQDFALAVVVVTPVFAACVVALRIYARRRTGQRLAWDDYLIILASFLSLLLIYPSIQEIYMWHIGVHIWDLNTEHLEPDFKAYHKELLAFNLIYTPILPLIKASIILLLIKVGWVVISVKRVLYGIFVFNAAACFGPWMCLIFLCPPLTNNTAGPTVFGGLKCLNPRQAATIYLFLVSVNLLTDLLICPIPAILMYNVRNISLRSRLTVIVCFALSFGATAIGAVRFKYNYDRNLLHRASTDWTYDISYILNHAENNIAITLACLPPLRSFLVDLISNRDEESQATAATIQRRAQTASPRVYGGSFITQAEMPPEVTDDYSPMEKKDTNLSSVQTTPSGFKVEFDFLMD